MSVKPASEKKIEPRKAEEPSEKSSEDKEDVYDFKFDLNDTKEKAPKKKPRRRNVNKEKGKTTERITRQKVTAKRSRKIIEPKIDANPVEIVQIDSSVEFVVATTSTKKNNLKKIETNKDIQTLKESVNKNIAKEQDRKENTIVITSPPNKTEDVQPFRPKNIFNNKTLSKGHDSTLRSTVLMKTLSPIQKTTSTFDFGSPWRPPISMFSTTKHFIQSTPYNETQTFETKKRNKEIKKKSMETSKKNMEPNKNMESNKENMEIDKENIDMNKKNIGRRDKERRKKSVSPRKKHAIQKKLPISENQIPQKLRATVAKKAVVPPAPARISLGEIKNVLLNNNVNSDNKQTVEPTVTIEHTEVNKSLVEQKKKKIVDFIDFSDTFDMLSESEKTSNVGNDVPLFMDLEPSHFAKPPQHSYRRKRAVKFDFSEDSIEEENVKLQPKKKKLTKSEKEHEKKINEWIKTVNTTFQEIEEYDLVIE
ncbi:hypothetical protein ALC60_13624 [Trachymyrmex zeteki]|uniref:Uncharacterized protein n=2 Tax=Mycetomoellerius zeteki TaxID=64791 RepID=A0A151WHS2_9HYME|nr:hypothetical protein ALC60_13624 [Trachymyrmex zeteki]